MGVSEIIMHARIPQLHASCNSCVTLANWRRRYWD